MNHWIKGPREAALTLHALPVADRQWVMERLEPRDRQRLQPLLDELRDLNIPQDQELIEQAIGAQAKSALVAQSSTRATLAAASAPQVAAQLKSEPPGLIAHVLAAQPWPWSEGLRQALDAKTRQEVAQATRELPPLPPECRLHDRLVDMLAQRLRQSSVNGEPKAALRSN